MCELAGELFTAAGLTAHARPEGGLSATLRLGSGPTLLVLGHADTVWPAGTARGWAPRREGDALTGPGVGDMKASLVMAAHGSGGGRTAPLQGIGAIEVLLIADEELGSVASRGWIEARADGASACLGLEAGWPGGGVVTARGAVGALSSSRSVAAPTALDTRAAARAPCRPWRRWSRRSRRSAVPTTD